MNPNHFVNKESLWLLLTGCVVGGVCWLLVWVIL